MIGFSNTLFNLLRLLKAEVQQGVCPNRNGLRELYEKLYFTWLLLHLLSLFLIKSKWILECAFLSLCLTRRPWSSRCVLPQNERDAARAGCWVHRPWQPEAICSSKTFRKFGKLYLIGRKALKCLHRGWKHENTCHLLSVRFNLKNFTVSFMNQERGHMDFLIRVYQWDSRVPHKISSMHVNHLGPLCMRCTETILFPLLLFLL